jgi:gluconokinase
VTATPRTVVVMGVSGAGKSKIGSALAEQLGWTFIDADDLHPLSNKAKMAKGHPFDDADLWPWLDIVDETAQGPAVATCSALRRTYRNRLLAGLYTAIFVELDASRPELVRGSKCDHTSACHRRCTTPS